MWGAADLPALGDPKSPASVHVSDRYIREAYDSTHVPNLVSAILADYRNFDTMFETAVVFTAGTAIFLILRLPLGPLARRRGRKEVAPCEVETDDAIVEGRGTPSLRSTETIFFHPARDSVLETACRILFPPVQLFGFYVLAHGHYSPGGGFQAGVILGASFILLALGFDLRSALTKYTETLYRPSSAIGLSIYVGTGLLCLLAGANFLDYESLLRIAPWISSEMIRSHGILLVECGVALTVSSVMFAIYVNLASSGDHREGL